VKTFSSFPRNNDIESEDVNPARDDLSQGTKIASPGTGVLTKTSGDDKR
jgi:hypothetical protein